jgi:hypothetical protein
MGKNNLRRKRHATREDLGLTRTEFAILRRLDTPEKIQQFVSAIPHNWELGGETCLSVRETLRQRRALCIEGAMVAAAALWVHGEPPLIMDLRATRDYDHIVTLFRRNGRWGAISKTNGPFLRWRDPVYRSLRELAMSYIHEYHNRRYQKTLREYSAAFDLRRIAPRLWVTGEKHCWDVGEMIDEARHYRMLTKKQEKQLRLRDTLEREAAKLRQHKPPKQK